MRDLFLTFLLICVTAIWGSTFVVVQDAIEQYPVIPFLAIRFIVATITLAIVSGRQVMIWRNSLITGTGIGLVLALGYLFQTLGLSYTTPTKSGLITGLCIVLVPLCDFLCFRLTPNKVNLGVLGVSAVGMILLTGFSPTGLGLGDTLTFACAICFGLHISLLSYYAKKHNVRVLALGQMAAAGVFFSTLWILRPSPLPNNQGVWSAILITGILASAVGFTIQSYVQKRLSSIRTAVILTTEPVFAAIFGYWLAGDRLSTTQLAGGCLIVGAMLSSELLLSDKSQK